METLTVVWRSPQRTFAAVPLLCHCGRLERLRVCVATGIADRNLLSRIAGAPRLSALCLHGFGGAGDWNDAGVAEAVRPTLPHCVELEWLVEGGADSFEDWEPAVLFACCPWLRRVDLRITGVTAADRAALATCLRRGLLGSVRDLFVALASPPDTDTDAFTAVSLTQSLSGCPRLETVTLALTHPSGDEAAVLTDLLRSGRCPALRSAWYSDEGGPSPAGLRHLPLSV